MSSKYDPFYRVRQFFRALRAVPLTKQEIERVREVLNPDALALYQSMPLGDQRHSLYILDALRAQGYSAPPLLQAALLHDVAKRDIGLGYRTIVILMNRLSPNVLPRMASENPHSWRYPLYRSLHHPAFGAELVAHAGLETDTLNLIRAHQDTAPSFPQEDAAQLTAWHRALKQLDDVN